MSINILRFALFIVPAALLMLLSTVLLALAYMLIYTYCWMIPDLATSAGNWSLRLGQRTETALDNLEAALRIIAERLRG